MDEYQHDSVCTDVQGGTRHLTSSLKRPANESELNKVNQPPQLQRILYFNIFQYISHALSDSYAQIQWK